MSFGWADVAFRSLYAEHGPALLRLATALTDGDRGRAEDLVQETMLRAWTHRNKMDIQHRSPWAWLATIVRRLAIDAHRARRVRPHEVELDDHVALTDSQGAEASFNQASVRAAIATLPGPQRQVLTEVYYRDRSVAETAHILQIPPGTVKSRTFYALRALRHALAAQMLWPSPCGPRRRSRPRQPPAQPQPPGRGRGCHAAGAKEAGA